METFQLPPLPPRKGKKCHRHRHHSCPPPPSPSGHLHHPFPEHSHVGRISHPFPDRHHHKESLKPPKHLKKVHKLQRKIMKAYKLPKSARHGLHYCFHVRFPAPFEEGALFWDHHSPDCCLHSNEAIDHHRPGCHGKYLHPQRTSCPLNKSDATRGEIAPGNPQAMENSADPLIEGGTRPLISNMQPADEPAPVIQAP